MGATMTNHDTNWAGTLLGIHALTSLHPGSGTALGAVDLPVQRERHTHWPTIAGSALKGILRDACREKVKQQYDDDLDTVQEEQRRNRRRKANEDELLATVFGPAKISADQNDAYAGALSVTDARLLAFPVRSLKGVFAWVTCPAVLQRLKRDAALVVQEVAGTVPEMKDNQVFLPAADCPCLIDDKHVVLEEFEF